VYNNSASIIAGSCPPDPTLAPIGRIQRPEVAIANEAAASSFQARERID
jgi:hypothetical protein